MPKVLVTGALGMIGRALCEDLLKKGGFTVDGIDIKEDPDNPFSHSIHYSNVDIRNKEAIAEVVRRGSYDCIVHLAAISRVVDGEKNKRVCIQTNYLGTINIVDAIKRLSPMTHIIFASSREVYGEQTEFPVPETAELLPLNVYGFYKLMAEQYIQSNLSKFTILRFCNVYGSIYDIPGRVIPNFILKALKDEEITIEGGRQLIDFTHIGDTVWAISRCISLIPTGEVNGETITISPGKGSTLQDLIRIISRDLGFQLKTKINPERDYDVQRFIGDPTKRKRLLGDREFIPVEVGINRTINLFRNHYKAK